MAERTEEQTRDHESSSGSDLGADETTRTDSGLGEIGATVGQSSPTVQETTTATDDAEVEGGGWFSTRALLFAFVAVGGGMVLGGLVPLVPFTGFLGIALGAFVYGLVASHRRYLELAVAGGVTGGVATLANFMTRLLLFDGISGVELFALAGGVGLVLAVLGHYFGRDLRDGLTRDLS